MPQTDVLFALVGDVRRNSRALRQIRALVEIGATVQVLTTGPAAPDAPIEDGVRLHVIDAPSQGGPRFFWKMHQRMREAALSYPARVYHASDLYTLPALHAAAQQHGGRLAYDARELYPYVGATAGKPWATLFWYALERRYIRRADAVFTVNESIADRLASSYRVERPVVLPNVPDRHDVQPAPDLREATGLSPDAVVVLFLGYLKIGRGCEMLLDAFCDVTGASLVFVGNGPLETSLQAQAQRPKLRGRVHFLPLVAPDRVVEVAAAADVGVALIEDLSASLYLSLPNKLFEYLGAGLPVLGSDFPEIRSVILGHDVGLVVDPHAREDVVRALQRMVDDAEARRRWAAHTRDVFETFGWEKTSQRFKHRYQSLLPAPGAP